MNKKIIFLCIIVLILTIGGFIGFFAYRSYIKSFTEIDSEYPVSYRTEKSGNITIALDGSKTKDLVWETSVENEEIVGVTAKGKESGGKAKFIISPKATGLSNVSFIRSDDANGYKYDVVKVSIPIYVVDNGGTLNVTFVDTPKIIIGSDAYGSDTQYPFMVGTNDQGAPTITFVNGQSDWTVSDPNNIVMTADSASEEGTTLVIVKNETANAENPVYDRQTTQLSVSSSSLGKSYTFDVTVEVDGTITVEDASKK